MKRLAVIGVLLVMLAGCTTSANDSSGNVLALENQKLKEAIEGRDKEIERLNDLLNEYNKTVSTKDSVYVYKGETKMHVKVLGEFNSDGLHKKGLIVTDLDEDHNTPLILTSEGIDLSGYKVGESYDVKVYIISYIDKAQTRFEFVLR